MPHKNIEDRRAYQLRNKEKRKIQHRKSFEKNYINNFEKRKINLENKKVYLKEYNKRPEIKLKNKIRLKEYYKNNFFKIKARSLARKEIKIPKNKICEFCNNLATDRHHPDYSRPLEVKFLCECCHIRLHQQKYK